MSRILYAASSMVHINNFHLDYINALRADGHEVLVMARGEGADFDIPFVKKNISRQNARCRREIRRILERERFDAIILNTTLAAFHIRRAVRGKGRPRVVNIVHGYLFPRCGGGLRARLLLACEKYLAKRTDRVLVMNGEDFEIATENRLSLEPPVLTLGFGASCRPPMSAAEKIRAELSCEGKFVISFVGELSDRKNQTLLIEALPEIKRHIPNAVLLLVGEGERREELAATAERLGVADSVVLTGKRCDPCDVIRASDAYASASKIEGMPFNIIEALGTGVPIVASDIKGHRDLLSDGAGILFDPADKAELAAKIVAVHDGAVRIDRAAAERTYYKYSHGNVYPKTLAAIKESIGV